MFVIALVASLFVLTSAAPVIGEDNTDCGFPNNTDKALHYYLCSGENEQFRIDNITVTNNQSVPYYPIDPKQPNILYLYTYNNGPQINDNKNDVKLYQYTTGWSGASCAWNQIPTYNLLNDIDGCKFAQNCPLTSGPLVLILPLDLTPFSPIINAIAAYKPYQLEIRIYNWNDQNPKANHPEICCIMVQLEMS